MEFTIRSIGTVINNRNDLSDDFWGGVVSEIQLDPSFDVNALEGIEAFSHLEIMFIFDRAVNDRPMTGSGHPRENPLWPLVGIFAQRKKNRPNFIGTAMASFIRKEGTSIFVRDLDAVNGTPVIDIKPVMKEFLPRSQVTQPPWADELMKNYWKERDGKKRIPVILDDLEQAIEDHCDFACYYLDRETGEIVFQSEHEFEDEEKEIEGERNTGGEDYRADRFIPIEPMDSRQGLEIMGSFIGTLPAGAPADQLGRALSMRKPFRRFKDILHNYPDLEKRWYAFHSGKIRIIADDWLRSNGIDHEFVTYNDLMKRHE